MPSSGYTANVFVAGEQPSTAKWNLLWGNDASFNSGNGFNDGIIVARHLANDSSFAWQQYTPALTGLTGLGTGGSNVGRWTQLGKTVHAQGKIILGSGLAWSGALTFALPTEINQAFVANEDMLSQSTAWMADSAVNMYPGLVICGPTTGGSNPTVAQIRAAYAPGTTGTNAIIAPSSQLLTNTYPFTFGANDWISWAVTYETA